MNQCETTVLEGLGDEEMKKDLQDILEEIEVEDLAVDGICGVY